MNRAVVRWAAVAAVLFVFFLLLTVPARHAWGWLGGGQLAVQGIEGTLWSGRVAHLANPAHPVFPVGPLAWHVRPQALLLGRLEYQVFVQSGTGGGELRVGRGLFGGASVTAAHLSVPAADLAQGLHLNLLTLAGEFQIDIDELRLSADGSGALPSVLEGVLVWRDARVVQPSPLSLGQLRMQLGLREGQVVGALSDEGEGGSLELSGELSIGADRQYRLDALLKPRATADAPLREALGLLGAPDAQGRYRLQYSGAL
ncbi:MAG: type II secretion system protein N [Gammaproteobacteria bacterium]|nr:type II secretion system protein N [Gammaproteobacteria bacterium]